MTADLKKELINYVVLLWS